MLRIYALLSQKYLQIPIHVGIGIGCALTAARGVLSDQLFFERGARRESISA